MSCSSTSGIPLLGCCDTGPACNSKSINVWCFRHGFRAFGEAITSPANFHGRLFSSYSDTVTGTYWNYAATASVDPVTGAVTGSYTGDNPQAPPFPFEHRGIINTSTQIVEDLYLFGLQVGSRTVTVFGEVRPEALIDQVIATLSNYNLRADPVGSQKVLQCGVPVLPAFAASGVFVNSCFYSSTIPCPSVPNLGFNIQTFGAGIVGAVRSIFYGPAPACIIHLNAFTGAELDCQNNVGTAVSNSVAGSGIDSGVPNYRP